MKGALNCWEFKKCGRQVGGPKAGELGVCPAATESRLDGTHGGVKSGRACWVVVGTLCGGKVQGTFAAKTQNCATCDFYERVRDEEGTGFVLSPILLKALRGIP